MSGRQIVGWSIGFFTVVLACFVLLFLGGLASAAWEIRQEKKAGKVPTRPAWDNRDKRRALGGAREQIRAAWAQASHRIPTCWCGRGPIARFAADGAFPEGYGCCAWESGDTVAILRHDAAGGYGRTETLAPDARAAS